jgi:hypothetical protein
MDVVVLDHVVCCTTYPFVVGNFVGVLPVVRVRCNYRNQELEVPRGGRPGPGYRCMGVLLW